MPIVGLTVRDYYYVPLAFIEQTLPFPQPGERIRVDDENLVREFDRYCRGEYEVIGLTRSIEMLNGQLIPMYLVKETEKGKKYENNAIFAFDRGCTGRIPVNG